MKIKHLQSFDAERFNITEQELEGLTLEQKVELISNKMQQKADEQTALKKEYDQKAVAAFNKMKKYKKLRSAAKAKAANIREKRGRFRKEYYDNIGLINKKLAKK